MLVKELDSLMFFKKPFYEYPFMLATGHEEAKSGSCGFERVMIVCFFGRCAAASLSPGSSHLLIAMYSGLTVCGK